MGCTDDFYYKTPQISGTFIAIKKTPFATNFVSEWLDCCSQAEIIAPVENPEKEKRDFISHREDQSVLSLLCKKYGIRAWQDPSQYGRLLK